MQNEIIAFYSSNARDLYKADIFRALALPRMYVIHFRYQKKYVQEEILSDLPSLINKNGIVYFAVVRDLTKPEDQREISFCAIRMVKIKDCDIDENNEMVNFYIEMGDFVSDLPITDTASQNQPPNLFVSKRLIENITVTNWIDRVNSVKEQFTDTLFYYIDSIKRAGENIEPWYSSEEKTSFFNLLDESEYLVHVSFYDPQNGVLAFNVVNSGECATLDVPVDNRLGAPRDTKIFTLSTHSLPIQKSIGRTRLLQPASSSSTNSSQHIDLTIELQWRVKKSEGKVRRFGFFTAMAALGIILANAVDNSFICIFINIIIAIAALFLIGFSAAKLYNSFDKR